MKSRAFGFANPTIPTTVEPTETRTVITRDSRAMNR